MRVVLDASVAVTAYLKDQPAHGEARRRVTRILGGHDELFVPPIFAIEVASALARKGASAVAAKRYLESLLAAARGNIPTLGPSRALKVAALAEATRLRAADTLYVWLAKERRATLLTLDAEVVDRGGKVCKVISV